MRAGGGNPLSHISFEQLKADLTSDRQNFKVDYRNQYLLTKPRTWLSYFCHEPIAACVLRVSASNQALSVFRSSRPAQFCVALISHVNDDDDR